MGNLPTNRQVSIAIIGTRRPTAYGKEIAQRLAHDLAQEGVVIISGLALGVDSIAHRAALAAGGITIAVMPSGLDRIYPANHYELAQEIVANGGALLSEYPPGSMTYPGNFVARNRLVSGFSDGVLIIEASTRSGTMHTAAFALDQGRPVMAVPGPVTSPVSAGCHNLLKTGACLVTDVDDVLRELGFERSAHKAPETLARSPAEKALLELLISGLRDGDELQQRSQLSPTKFSQTLTMLELNGVIRALGGNQWGLR